MLPVSPPTLAALALRVSAALVERNETVAVAESAAGGLVCAALLGVPGASRYFLGGTVIYTRRAGKALLGLSRDDMVGIRGETEPYAELLAQRIRANLGATWGLSESGAAGPSASPYGDPPGRACIAASGPVSKVATIHTGVTGRAENMGLFAYRVLWMFAEVLASLDKDPPSPRWL